MTSRLRIFLDANVLFSAAKSDGAVQSLVARLIDAGHECWVNEYVVEEARRNIVAKAPPRLQQLSALISQLRVAVVVPVITEAEAKGLPEKAHGLPEKDRVVLAAAVALECDVLVTGDRSHFGKLYGRLAAGVRIHSPRSLYEQLFPGS